VPIPPHPLPPAGNPDDPGQDWLSGEDEALAGLPAEGSAGTGPDELYAIDPSERSTEWDDDWTEGSLPPSGSVGPDHTTDRARRLRAAFSCGGPADVMLPGVALADLADEMRQAGPEHLDDDQLTGLLQAAHRLNAWAAELKLSLISQLAARRSTEARATSDWRCVEHVNDEVAVALTLTKWSADRVLSLAVGLDRLPRTRAALAAGALDERRAEIIVDELSGLSDEDAATVEELLLDKAPSQTSAELRRAAHRAVIAADPAAARRRKQKALLDARVEAFTEAAGTAALAGRDLPPAEVIAADRNLTALALDLRKAGAEGTLDQLRARAYLNLLNGQPSGAPPLLSQVQPGDVPPGETPPGETPPGPSHPQSPGKTGRPVLRGSVHLTLPLATWLGWSQAPGQVAGFGPLDADDSRAIAAMLGASPANRWCITLTGPADRPIAHGCARTGPPPSRGAPGSGPSPPRRRPPHRSPPGRVPGGAGPPGSADWARQVTIKPLETGACTHGRESPGYQPGRALRHLIQIRNATCTAPGCRRPATCGDLDHTTPHHLGGRTCECNLGPLCRWHHRCKQTPGWGLVQASPGTFTWTAPSGRGYRTTPTEYPC
jgi:hypothetical protein